MASLLASVCLAASSANAQPALRATTPFKAVGHEPGWALDIGANRIVLVSDSGTTRTEVPLPIPVPVEGGRRYDARTEAHTLVVTILDRVCADAMTGMPRPAIVELTLDGRVLKGCGGDPIALLRGGTWFVSAVGGQPLVPASRVTMAFGAGGRVAGTTSCNSYSAGYVLTGEGLTMTMPIASMRSCDPPVMAQEALFLEILRGVNRFELGQDGALTLQAADGGTIVSRREGLAATPPAKPRW